MEKYLLTLIAVLTASIAFAKTFTVNTVEGVPMWFYVTSEQQNKCAVVAIPKNTTGTVTIPEWANDYSVEEIYSEAFKDCRNLTNVIIPEGITRINEEAFSGCTGLTTVLLPESLYKIGYRAFYNCTGLTSIVIPMNCSLETWTFGDCVSLSSVVLPESMTEIPDCAFYGCISLASITLPENLQVIRVDAFVHCELLSSFHIPASVKGIYGNPVRGCNALASITVAEGNTSYDSRENCNAIINYCCPIKIGID